MLNITKNIFIHQLVCTFIELISVTDAISKELTKHTSSHWVGLSWQK